MSESGEPAAPCPRCGGRGWIVEADGRAGSARPCGCRKRDDVPRLLAAAEIPPLYRRCTLENFRVSAATAAERDQLLEARSRCQRYVEEFVREDGSFCDSGLLFVGKPGVGKTHLAAAVLAELIRRYRVRGRFVDFTSLVHRIQSTFDPTSDASKHEVLDPVAECEVLVLDELGAQQPSEWVRNTLYLILNSRYTHQLPTLFTTNYPLAPEPAAAGQRPDRRETDFEQRQLARHEARDEHRLSLQYRISEGLVSRLYEMTGRPIEINVEDYRREIKMQRHAG